MKHAHAPHGSALPAPRDLHPMPPTLGESELPPPPPPPPAAETCATPEHVRNAAAALREARERNGRAVLALANAEREAKHAGERVRVAYVAYSVATSAPFTPKRLAPADRPAFTWGRDSRRRAAGKRLARLMRNRARARITAAALAGAAFVSLLILALS